MFSSLFLNIMFSRLLRIFVDVITNGSSLGPGDSSLSRALESKKLNFHRSGRNSHLYIYLSSTEDSCNLAHDCVLEQNILLPK